MRTLLAASGGGHLVELVQLRRRLPFDPGEVIWFVPDSSQSRALLEGEHLVPARPAPPRDWRSAVTNARLTAALLRRCRVDVAVSTGASVAASVLPVARRHGVRAVFIESAARVDGPSMSGRMVAACPGVETYTQYAEWTDRRWHLAGSVFDSFGPGPRRPPASLQRVVVTVGSQDGYPFRRLIERLADVLPIDDANIVWQTGSAEVADLGVVGRASVPADQLERAMELADVVVSHAGVGSALSALQAGRHPVLVPRRRDAGEHVDDHQVQIARELSRRGLATVCTPEAIDLDLLIDAASRSTVVNESAPALALTR